MTVPAGRFSVGGDGPTTRNTTQLCRAGTFAQAGWSACLPCGAGEVSGAGSVQCDVCPDGTFASGLGTECLPCIGTGATCNQGVLTLLPGFWSSALVSVDTGKPKLNLSAVALGATFYECPPNACVVDDDSRLQCAAHRAGPLCALCEGDYVLSGDQCEECGSTAASWVLLIVCCAFLVLGVVVVIRNSTRHLIDAKADQQDQGSLVLPLIKVWRRRSTCLRLCTHLLCHHHSFTRARLVCVSDCVQLHAGGVTIGGFSGPVGSSRLDLILHDVVGIISAR